MHSLTARSHTVAGALSLPPLPVRAKMDLDNHAATTATWTAGILGILGGIRWAWKTFHKDRLDVDTTTATNQVITMLREEVARLSKAVSTLSDTNMQLQRERDHLRLQVLQLDFAVKSMKSVMENLAGPEKVAEIFNSGFQQPIDFEEPAPLPFKEEDDDNG